MSEISFEVDSQGVGMLTVNRPRVRNALSWEAMQGFANVVESIHAHRQLRALIVTGAGEAFIAGGDLSELQHYPTREDGLRLATIMGTALNRLEALPCPTIAALNGPARGGGAEIAVACDIRIMAENASVGFVHTTLGLIPGWGGGQRLLRIVGYPIALELLATGRVLTASEAQALQLINQITPVGQAVTAAQALAAQIAANPPMAVQIAKRVLRFGLIYPQNSALDKERAEFPALWESDFRQAATRKFLDT